MPLDLVIDIGNVRIKGGLFEDDRLAYNFAFAAFPYSKDKFTSHIASRPIQMAFISSVNSQLEMHIKTALAEANIPYSFLNYAELQLKLEVEKPEALGHDRIANAYGALARFPLNDCIIVDIGSAITCDLVTKDGRYLGGMIYPGPEMCAKALTGHTDSFPHVIPIKPSSPLGATTEMYIQSGIYYGQLGAIERLIAELSSVTASASSVKIIATGGATHIEDALAEDSAKKMTFVQDLKELVDIIDPNLTLVGLHEILKEQLSKKRR
jgi:type III pantothenate kinase